MNGKPPTSQKPLGRRFLVFAYVAIISGVFSILFVSVLFGIVLIVIGVLTYRSYRQRTRLSQTSIESHVAKGAAP
jgi:uncharacterized membrane protein HdeD (DUF308 family)